MALDHSAPKTGMEITSEDLPVLKLKINSKYYETCEIEEGETGQFEIFKSGKSILSKKDHGDFFEAETLILHKSSKTNKIVKNKLKK